MKSLDSLLHSLRLRSAIQNRVVLGEPWGVAFEPVPRMAKFHFLEHGSGILAVCGEAPVRMEQGDLAIVFANVGHSVQDNLGTPPIDVVTLMQQAEVICISGLTLQFGGNGPQTSVISGDFGFEAVGTHPLWRVLPSYILLKGQEGRAAGGLDVTLDLLSREAMQAEPGMTAVLDRLCDVLFIQALRGWVRTDCAARGWPSAVKDQSIDEALNLMQRSPAEPWTVEKLASRVALSRSTFADKFHRLMDDTPMEYLTRWRMHIAAQLLCDDQDSVAVIAQKVGYESEAAFSKAFKRRLGIAPGAYRRNPQSLREISAHSVIS